VYGIKGNDTTAIRADCRGTEAGIPELGVALTAPASVELLEFRLLRNRAPRWSSAFRRLAGSGRRRSR